MIELKICKMGQEKSLGKMTFENEKELNDFIELNKNLHYFIDSEGNGMIYAKSDLEDVGDTGTKDFKYSPAKEHRESMIKLMRKSENTTSKTMLEENRRLVLTERATGQTLQSLLLLMHDPKVIILTGLSYGERQYLRLLENEFHYKKYELKQFADRIYTPDEWKNGKLNGVRLPEDFKLHVEHIEYAFSDLVGTYPSTFTTQHYSVANFTNKYEEAQLIEE